MASSASTSSSSSSALAAPTDDVEVMEVLKTTSMKKKKLKFTKNKRYVRHTSRYTCSVLLSYHAHNACWCPPPKTAAEILYAVTRPDQRPGALRVLHALILSVVAIVTLIS